MAFYSILLHKKKLSEETTANQKTQYDSDLKRTGQVIVEFFHPAPFDAEIAQDFQTPVVQTAHQVQSTDQTK